MERGGRVLSSRKGDAVSDDRRRYSKVFRRIWNDARFRSLSEAPPNGQTLFLRLLTGPELTNIPGVFACGEAALAEALGWPLEGFREAFAEAFREGMAKADWKARFVFIPKAIHYNAPESPNVIRSWRQAWDELPECSLKNEAYRTLKGFVEGLGEGFRKAFAEACPDPSPNQKQEQEQEQDRERDVRAAVPAATPPTAAADRRRRDDPKPQANVQAKTAKGSRLHEVWRPSPKILSRFAADGVDAMATSFERFQNHWLTSTGRNAAKLDWDRAFANWVLGDIDKGRTVRIESGALPILRLPNRDALIPAIDDAEDFTGARLGGAK